MRIRPSTRRYAASALLLASLAAPASAHTKERALREMVWVRGTVIEAAASCATAPVTLNSLNRSVRLCDGEVRRVAVAASDIAAATPLPDAFDLQGERERLATVVGAAVGWRITLLGEWRPGRKDLFLIEIDACPCPNAPQRGTDKE